MMKAKTNHSPMESQSQPPVTETILVNGFSLELIAQSQMYSKTKSPDGAVLATILNILATSTTDELFEIYQKITNED